MDKRFLEECLAKGMSLDAIGKLAGRHSSTIGYWLKKHGLTAVGAGRHTPKGSIDAARLQVLVDDGLSIRQIADELGVGYSTVRYWLKRLNLATDGSVRRIETETALAAGHKRTYLRCAKHGHTAFFERRDGGYRCVKCRISAVSERRRQVKRQLVEEAGGSCRICGFDEHQAALQFHHVDPSSKAFHLSHRGLTRSIDRMRAEARKCVLLCSNCHALVEAGIKEVSAEDR